MTATGVVSFAAVRLGHGDRLGISRLQVNRWAGRFVSDRLAGLRDAPGRGRKPWLAEGAAQQVLERAVTPPPDLGR